MGQCCVVREGRPFILTPHPVLICSVPECLLQTSERECGMQVGTVLRRSGTSTFLAPLAILTSKKTECPYASWWAVLPLSRATVLGR